MKKLFILSFFVCLLFGSDTQKIEESYFKSYDYEKMGRYEEAIKVLIPIYKKYPKGYTLNLRLGWLFYLDKKYNDAIKYYKKASILNTYALDPRIGLIRIHLDRYDYEKAEHISYEVMKIDYYNFYANLYAIKALILQKKYDIALKITRKMLALYPTNISYLEQLAIIYKQTNSKYLKQLYDDILTLDPNNVLVRSELK